MKYFFLIASLLFLTNTVTIVKANEISLEEEIKQAFENYPFQCNLEGSTPEIAACYWIELIKSDRALREELSDKEMYEGWVKYRGEVCNFFQNKMYAGGTIRQI